MMHGREKSDPAIVAVKPANKAANPAVEQSAAEPATAEPVEPRAGTKGNADQQSTCRAQSRVSVSQALDRIRKVAKERKKEKLTALFHHISIDLLEEAFYELKENAAPGVDRLTWKDYEAGLERKLEDLHDRVHRGAYRALPSRRVYIPKPDGRQRPLAVAALEDKIVQRAVVTLLNAIYEEDFLGFSCGFRPGRGTHDALDALCVGICRKKASFILDADIRSFFDEISHDWLIRFLEHRIGDRRIIRLIQKWLKAGVLEDGVVMVSDRGTGQGSVISPRPPVTNHDDPVFEHARLQPFLDQADDAPVADPVLQEADQPVMTDLIEERPDVGVQYEAHLLAADPDTESIQRIVRAAPGSEPAAEPEEVLLVDRVQQRDHRPLDDLVLQRGDRQRTLPAVRLGNVDPPRRQCPIRSPLDPVVQILEIAP